MKKIGSSAIPACLGMISKYHDEATEIRTKPSGGILISQEMEKDRCCMLSSCPTIARDADKIRISLAET